jgi:hypothetical protein
VLAAVLGACEPAVPVHTIDVPPRLADERPPRSVAFVRDDVPLGGLRDAIERAIPPLVEGAKALSLPGLRDAEVTYRLERRPVVLHAEPSGLSLEVALVGPVSFRAGDVRCQAPSGGLSFLVATRPALRPGGELSLDHLDWKPVVHGTLLCGVIPVPLGAALGLALEPLARALVQGVQKIEIPLGPAIRAGLAALRTPQTIALGGKGGEACLDLDPGAAVLAPVGGAGEAMTLKLGVDVAPRVTLGACPANADTGSSPGDRVLVRTVPLQDHFEIAVAVAVPYTNLEARATPAVVGHRFGEGDRSVTIDAVDLGDAQGRALARVRVHGALNGDIYLWGTPEVIEQAGRFTLKVPDLQVAVESRSVLEKIGLWLWQLAGGGLEGLLREKLSLDVTDRIQEARAALSGRHELGPGAPVLTTALDKIRPGTVTSRAGALVLYPTLVGRADLSFGSSGSFGK